MVDLVGRLARLAGEYEGRKAAASALAVRWEWFSFPGVDPRPLWFERDQRLAGLVLRERPPVGQDALRIGFDGAGRPVVRLVYSGYLGGALYSETFTRYDGDLVEEAQYGQLCLREYRYAGGLMRSSDSVTERLAVREVYGYDDDGRVSGIEVERDGRPWSSIAARWDEAGLVAVYETYGKWSETRYERPPAGFDIGVACREVEDALVALIPGAVAAMALDGPADCLALTYEYPARLAFSLHATAERVRPPLDIETVAEFEGTADVDLDGIAALLRLVRQELRMLDAREPEQLPGSAAGRRLFEAVAARLNRHDWAGKTTDTFTVYAVSLS